MSKEYPVTPKEMREFEKKFRNGEFPHQRYGQAFCNHFNIHSSVLFYMENEKTARFRVWLNYVNCEEIYEGDE